MGSQSVVVGIDVRKVSGQYVIYSHCASTPHFDVKLLDYVCYTQKLGAGEIFINSIDRDGMMQGYDLQLLTLVRSNTSLPLIACGGAGHFRHLVEAFQEAHVNAVGCASLFHFGDNNPLRAKAYLKNHGIPLKSI